MLFREVTRDVFDTLSLGADDLQVQPAASDAPEPASAVSSGHTPQRMRS